MSHLKSTLIALALLCPLTACDSADEGDVETRAVANFEDGMGCDSDQGAFRVMLWSDTGDIQVGRNDLVLRLGFHDPLHADAPGQGIPNAQVNIDAWMPTANESMQTEPVITYIGDGQYRIENMVLTDDGVWNIDFDVAIGESMRESISLAFEID